jgi:hypothetical protein
MAGSWFHGNAVIVSRLRGMRSVGSRRPKASRLSISIHAGLPHIRLSAGRIPPIVRNARRGVQPIAHQDYHDRFDRTHRNGPPP